MHLTTIYAVAIALLLDWVIGDPRNYPHPVKLIGSLARRLEKIFYSRPGGGLITVLIIYTVSFMLPLILLKILASWPVVQFILEAIIIYTTLSLKDLLVHSRWVRQALKSGNIERSRKAVGMMVGRDTAELDEAGVAQATFESVAENFSDGVIAPLFFALIGGAPLAMLYKSINTCDSMFGYKNTRYHRFGFWAAKIDDLANFIPARLAAFGVAIAAPFIGLSTKNCLKIIRRDAKKHLSPNSGYPESAFAGACGVKIGGTHNYGGKRVVKPTIGNGLNKLTSATVEKAETLCIITTVTLFPIIAAGLVIAKILL
ncbi:MAG: adenosylcobinamide-phosphate synthase CbiB [Victivallaceae bacterium]|nr:adenosylcobinamide-phosphate synthase CbiB [Victivallaceae bacterium]